MSHRDFNSYFWHCPLAVARIIARKNAVGAFSVPNSANMTFYRSVKLYA